MGRKRKFDLADVLARGAFVVTASGTLGTTLVVLILNIASRF